MRVRTLVATWAAMLALLALSIGITFVPIGGWRQVVSLSAASVKAGLILWLFMGLRREEGIARLWATGALAFLAIMLTLFSADNLTRGWLSD